MTKVSGRLDGARRTLVLTRRIGARADELWQALAQSDRLERWFGSWRGDPSSGQVMLTMNAEAAPVPAVPCEIRVCDPPQRLGISVTDSYGHWQLTIELRESNGMTDLTLRHEDIELQAVPEVGPGWEWYLDRLEATVTGSALPTLEDFVDCYTPMGEDYSAMIVAE